MTGAPVALPVVASFGGISKESPTAPGTGVAMTNTLPGDLVKYEDKFTYLDDKGLRGVMGNDAFNEVQGVYYCDVSAIGGNVYADTFPFFLANILGDVVETGTAAPYTHAVSLLNPTSGAPSAQPTTHTLTVYTGLTPSVGARWIPYFCLSQMVISWDNPTGMLSWTGKGQGWKSTPAGARPAAAPSAVVPKASWIGQLAVGGALPGAAVANLETAKVTITRELENEFTGNGMQNPLMIARAAVSVAFDFTFLAQDETYYNDAANNTQPQLQALFSTGSAGTLTSLQLDMQQGAFTKVPLDGSKKMYRWNASGKSVYNSTNVGASGGLGPITATVKNAVVSGTYA